MYSAHRSFSLRCLFDLFSLGVPLLLRSESPVGWKGHGFMAQRVNVVLVDDIDGSDAAETVSFALDGVDYEIDLSDEHANELREAISLYVGHARRTGGRRRGNRRS